MRHCPSNDDCAQDKLQFVAVAIFIKVKVFPAAASEALVMVNASPIGAD